MFSLVETEYSMGCWPCTWRWLQCFRDINHSWELAHVCKSTRFRVSAQFLYVPISVCLVAQSCPTLCDPMDCSPPGSAVHGDSLGKKIGVGCHSLLQRIFPTQGSNPRLPHCTWILYHLSYQRSPHHHLSFQGVSLFTIISKITITNMIMRKFEILWEITKMGDAWSDQMLLEK